jgi:hypothetical protein
MAFRKQTGHNIREHIIKSGCSRYNGQIFNNKKKKTGKGSGHNEHHEKVNKCKTLGEKDK